MKVAKESKYYTFGNNEGQWSYFLSFTKFGILKLIYLVDAM